MNFVTYQRLLADTLEWAKQLEPYDAVCGLPRSGLIPASVLAQEWNCRLIPWDRLTESAELAILRSGLRSNNPDKLKPVRRVLIVDDTSSDRGVTILAARKSLADTEGLEFTYGAVYRANESSPVDVYYREVAMPRIFQWNWLRHYRLQRTLFDFDGVLCEDWAGPPEQDEDQAFRDHVCNVKPLYLPRQPILGVVTSRLERYRDESTKWLRQHGVSWQGLMMHPAETPQERRAAGDHAERKAAEYARRSEAELFVESDARQAKRIAEFAKKPVLCTENWTMYSDNN